MIRPTAPVREPIDGRMGMADASRAPRSSRAPLTILLAVSVVVLAGTAYWLRGAVSGEEELAADRQAAVRAAAAHAVSLLSLDHRTVDDDIKRVLATSAGPEREEYDRGRDALKAAALKNKVVQTGVLRGAALASMSGDRRTAQVLIVADAVVHWEDGRKTPPEERFYRWRMEVTRASGLWLVSRSELVQ
ncbi:hypothetical protein [Microbispora sp. NPDC046933]|uniref:hypothetical protein n=1 Tax=Microbispora sp. NPDC046933 TaxID=3155618 RepID=UPI0033E68BD1